MEVSELFEKFNKTGSDVFTRECGCPYRFQPTDSNRSRKPVRNRSRSRARSSSGSSQRAVIQHPVSQRSASHTDRPTTSPGDKYVKKMQEVRTAKKLEEEVYIPPKRYETTCYFMPLAVPVWYSTSVSLRINSTKKRFTETVNYKQKLVPYRYTETMTTVTPNTEKPIIYLSNLSIEREIPAEHYISLEPQQEAAKTKSHTTNQIIDIENHM